VVEVSIYQTEDLSEGNGRTPESVVAKHLEQAFERAGLNYRIEYGHKTTFDPPMKTNDIENLRWWSDKSPEHAKDSNILLYDAKGGGRGYVGGKNCIAGVNRIRDDVDASPVCTKGRKGQCRNIRAALHEVGHNLKGRHTTPILQDLPMMLYHPNMVDTIKEKYF
jgi:hypothetical protein